MKVNIFTVADSVALYEQGKLVIVGTFDNIHSDGCPFVFRPFGIALKLTVGPRDYGKNYDGRLVLRKIHTSKAVVEMPVSLKVPRPPKGRGMSVIFAANIGNIKFESFGVYVFEFKVGSKVLADINLNIIKTPLKKKQTADKNNK